MERLTAARSENLQRMIAGALVARGLGRGDRIALLTSSSGSMLSAILGALRVGVVPVLLNNGLLDHERSALLDDADPSLIVDDRGLAELEGGPPIDLAPFPLARPMHYTSGTTGTPKGVWSGILEEAEAAALFEEEAELWGFDRDDRHLVCSPFHHSVSIRFAGGTLLRGGEVLIMGKFDAAVTLDAITQHRPTTAFMVPAHLHRLFEHAPGARLPGFRLLAHAGAPCPPPLKTAAIEAFGLANVWEFYGSTEGQFTACPARDWLDRSGTVGRARPGRVLSVDDGVIWCEVPSHARFEYWRDPLRTAEAWRESPTGGRAFTVRDLGRLDDAGYLYLEGRRDDLIISGGVNVYPAEVEQVLSHAPGVAEVAVFGVDDERWGQRVCVAVVWRPGSDRADLGAWARGRLAPFKCPKDVYTLEALPRTATGKVQRSRILATLGFD